MSPPSTRSRRSVHVTTENVAAWPSRSNMTVRRGERQYAGVGRREQHARRHNVVMLTNVWDISAFGRRRRQRQLWLNAVGGQIAVPTRHNSATSRSPVHVAYTSSGTVKRHSVQYVNSRRNVNSSAVQYACASGRYRWRHSNGSAHIVGGTNKVTS